MYMRDQVCDLLLTCEHANVKSDHACNLISLSGFLCTYQSAVCTVLDFPCVVVLLSFLLLCLRIQWWFRGLEVEGP